MTKVLHVGKFFPPPFGGIESVCVSVIDCVREDVDLEFVVSAKNSRSATRDFKGVRIHELPTPATVASQPLTFGFFPWLRRHAPRFDIVHLHLPNPLASAAVLFALWGRPNIRLVLTWHSDIVRQVRLERLLRPLTTRLLARADVISAATPAHFAASPVLAPVDAGKKWVTPFYIEPAKLVENSEDVHVWKERFVGRKLVAACGRHVEYKGFAYLVRAMKALPDDVVLVIAGEGPLSDSLALLIKQEGLVDRVHLPGSIARPALLGLLNACDAFCLPSITQAEAFGIAMAEAMSCGKPVVCCELGNGVNALSTHGETGLTVPPKDPEALAGAISTLLSSPALAAKLGAAGEERILRDYSMHAMRSSLVRLYGAGS
jgi:glycosyltransferase involved in cell wall biosynthesis